MKYEAPELVVLTPAVDSIQTGKAVGEPENPLDAGPSYEDWE